MSKIVACAQGIDRRAALLARGCRLGDPASCARLKAEGIAPDYAAGECEVIECPGFIDNPDAGRDCLAGYAATHPKTSPPPTPASVRSGSGFGNVAALGGLLVGLVGAYLTR